jgi:hypothetical protein
MFLFNKPELTDMCMINKRRRFIEVHPSDNKDKADWRDLIYNWFVMESASII